MAFVGIDMAADPRRTGIARLREAVDECMIESVEVGADDDTLVATISSARKVGVDVPLGWPQRFVELLGLHADSALPVPPSTGAEWRRDLAMRATDREVHRRTGLTPLSVSTDRIAHPALRWAGIEARLRESGIDTARDGSGRICEVYPAAALHRWSLPHRGYKGPENLTPRTELVAALSQALPWLDWNGHREQCAADDDALDAVVAALIAREVERGRGEPPPRSLRAAARREGWIWIPRHRSQALPPVRGGAWNGGPDPSG